MFLGGIFVGDIPGFPYCFFLQWLLSRPKPPNKCVCDSCVMYMQIYWDAPPPIQDAIAASEGLGWDHLKKMYILVMTEWRPRLGGLSILGWVG